MHTCIGIALVGPELQYATNVCTCIYMHNVHVHILCMCRYMYMYMPRLHVPYTKEGLEDVIHVVRCTGVLQFTVGERVHRSDEKTMFILHCCCSQASLSITQTHYNNNSSYYGKTNVNYTCTVQCTSHQYTPQVLHICNKRNIYKPGCMRCTVKCTPN